MTGTPPVEIEARIVRRKSRAPRRRVDQPWSLLASQDVVEVGAGGGSIGWIDSVGALKVGPRSAGAHPGPVCYRAGGEEPTITDANVVLGRINSENFLGGDMSLDKEASRRAIKSKLADRLGLTVEDAALGMLKIAIAHMTLAVRGVSIERGYDPQFGARPLKRSIQRLIQDPLALKILEGEVMPGETIEVDADMKKGEMTFAPVKAKAARR